MTSLSTETSSQDNNTNTQKDEVPRKHEAAAKQDGGLNIMDAVRLPRVTISYCTQCRWMLRAAYFAQELLSTFSTDLGEVALIPGIGGIFEIEVVYQPLAQSAPSSVNGPESKNQIEVSPSQQNQLEKLLLWERKRDGGFPEVKELKRRLRDIIQPGRNLGHVDRHHGKKDDQIRHDGSDLKQQKPQDMSGEDKKGKQEREPQHGVKEQEGQQPQEQQQQRDENTAAEPPADTQKGDEPAGEKTTEACEDC